MDPAEDTLVGPRYAERESGEFLIKAVRSMDSTDEGVLDIGLLRPIVADDIWFGKLVCGKSITVDFNDVAVDGGPPCSDPGWR